MIQTWWQCAYYPKETNVVDSCITRITTVLPYACCPVLACLYKVAAY